MANQAIKQRTKRPHTRRQELLDAAVRLIFKSDTTDLRVEDITEAAGAAKGTFYRYFRSKDDVVAALRERFVSDLLAEIRARDETVAECDWNGRCTAYVETLVDYYLNSRVLHDALYHRMWDGGPADEEGDSGSDITIVRWFANLISDGVVSGAFRVRDPWLAASLIYSSLHGAIERELHVRKRIDRDHLVSSATEMITKALAPVSPPVHPNRDR